MKPDGLSPSDGRRFYNLIEEAKRRRESDTRSPTERRRDQLNSEKDWLDPEEYNCPVCQNRGFTAVVYNNNGYDYMLTPECRCMDSRDHAGDWKSPLRPAEQKKRPPSARQPVAPAIWRRFCRNL